MNLSLDHSSSTPLHLQAEELLREMIEMPEFQNGKLLPKEIDLAKRLGINRNTLRQAINKLVIDGLIIRKKGIGTTVSKTSVTTKLENWHSFTQEMNQKGIQFLNYSIETEWVLPSQKIASFFNVDAQLKIIKLSRLRGDKDSPFVYFESYFHPRIGITGKEDFKRPLYDILEQDYSSVPSISRENIKARSVTPDLAKKLRIHPGDPILVRERFVSDPGDRPLEYNIGYYRADEFEYSIEVKRIPTGIKHSR